MLGHPAHLPKRQDFSTAAALKSSETLWGEVNECSQRGDTGCTEFSLRKTTLDGGPELALGAHRRVALVTCKSSCLLWVQCSLVTNWFFTASSSLAKGMLLSTADVQNSPVVCDLCPNCMPRCLTCQVTVSLRKQWQFQTWLLLSGFEHFCALKVHRQLTYSCTVQLGWDASHMLTSTALLYTPPLPRASVPCTLF